MINETLNTLMDNIQQLEKDSNIILESVDTKTLPAWTIRKNQAKEQIVGLKAKYQEFLKNTTLNLYAVGVTEQTQKFAYIAHKEAGTTTINADELFRTLANRIYPSLGPDKQIGVPQLNLLTSEIFALSEENGTKLSLMDSMPSHFMRKVNTPYECNLWIREYLTRYLGYEFINNYVNTKILNEAVDQSFKGDLLPLVIIGLLDNEVEALKLLNKQSFKIILNSDREVNKELVFGTLKEVKSALKNKDTK